MSKYNLLKSFVFNTNAQKILGYFLKNPSQKQYDREIANTTDVSRAGTNLALRELAKMELLGREQKGRMFFYSLNKKNALIAPLKIVQNIVELKPLVDLLQSQALKIILYGSAATGENQEESDIDLFILTRFTKEVQEKLHSSNTENKIHLVAHTPQEWALMETQNPVFKNEVEKGLILWRSDER